MHTPTSLYVKWRPVGSESIRESSVELTGLSSSELDGARIYINIKYSYIAVYLITDGGKLPREQDINTVSRGPIRQIAILR
jgi:hypothetical protein